VGGGTELKRPGTVHHERSRYGVEKRRGVKHGVLNTDLGSGTRETPGQVKKEKFIF